MACAKDTTRKAEWTDTHKHILIPWPEWEWMAVSSAKYSMWINDNNVEKKISSHAHIAHCISLPATHTRLQTLTTGRVSVRALELSQSFFLFCFKKMANRGAVNCKSAAQHTNESYYDQRSQASINSIECYEIRGSHGLMTSANEQKRNRNKGNGFLYTLFNN